MAARSSCTGASLAKSLSAGLEAPGGGHCRNLGEAEGAWARIEAEGGGGGRRQREEAEGRALVLLQRCRLDERREGWVNEQTYD